MEPEQQTEDEPTENAPERTEPNINCEDKVIGAFPFKVQAKPNQKGEEDEGWITLGGGSINEDKLDLWCSEAKVQ